MDNQQISFEWSTQPEDQEWDRFLSESDSGHHEQSSCWGQVKADSGWGVVRVKARVSGSIHGGAQVLLKNLGPLGTIGYIPNGPFCFENEPKLLDVMVKELLKVAREHSCSYLVANLPRGGDPFVPELLDNGFEPHPPGLHPSDLPKATLIVNLRQDLGKILSQMRAKTR